MVFNAFTYFIGQTFMACSIYYIGNKTHTRIGEK
jgi:hypothetical protein